MSMICSISSVADSTIETLRKHPQLTQRFFSSEKNWQAFIARRQTVKLGFVAKLFGKTIQPPQPLPEITIKENEAMRCHLDKAWHGIHFLLCGSAWEGEGPLNFVAEGGEPIEGTDSGYGPVRAFTSVQVKTINQKLQKISKEEFESRFDPPKMMEEGIYPNIWDRPKEEDDTLGYISEYFGELKKYMNGIAQNNMGMLVSLT